VPWCPAQPFRGRPAGTCFHSRASRLCPCPPPRTGGSWQRAPLAGVELLLVRPSRPRIDDPRPMNFGASPAVPSCVRVFRIHSRPPIVLRRTSGGKSRGNVNGHFAAPIRFGRAARGRKAYKSPVFERSRSKVPLDDPLANMPEEAGPARGRRSARSRTRRRQSRHRRHAFTKDDAHSSRPGRSRSLGRRPWRRIPIAPIERSSPSLRGNSGTPGRAASSPSRCRPSTPPLWDIKGQGADHPLWQLRWGRPDPAKIAVRDLTPRAFISRPRPPTRTSRRSRRPKDALLKRAFRRMKTHMGLPSAILRRRRGAPA